MLKLLIVEDDPHLRELLDRTLRRQGYQTTLAADGHEGWLAFTNEHVDLVLSDVMMPNMDGNHLIQQIRDINPDVPILMLTALDSFSAKERSFLGGADDYMVKPIDVAELSLRIKALLRRSQIASEHRLTHKSLVLNHQSMVATLADIDLELTPKEFELLFVLLSHPNRIFTREQLMNEIWGYDSESFERTVDTHIKRLRDKLDTEDIELVTVRGLGYKAVPR
jgi:DNA-binding response OmpR family regulator